MLLLLLLLADVTKQEIEEAAKNLLEQEAGRQNVLMRFSRKPCAKSVQPNVLQIVFPANPGFIRRSCDGGLTIASREATPPPPPPPCPPQFTLTTPLISIQLSLKIAPLLFSSPLPTIPMLGREWERSIVCVLSE